MAPASLSLTQQRRLELLARRADRTPKAMLKFVLRNGFDACEEDMQENRLADVEFSAGSFANLRHANDKTSHGSSPARRKCFCASAARPSRSARRASSRCAARVAPNDTLASR
jgi:hypothetical protein